MGGIGITQWGYYEDARCYDLGSKAILASLRDADMEWQDIQAAFCGSVYQGTGSGHQAIKDVGLTGIPIVNVENACSSAASAFRLAYQSVAAEIYDMVMVLGMEKMPRGPIPSNAFREWKLKLGFNMQPANYALLTQKYLEKTGATIEDVSLVTVKNRRNGALNPNARFQKPVTVEEVLASRMISAPLRLLHCCPLADGAVAFILCSRDKFKAKHKVVTVAASVLITGVYGEEYPPGDIVGSLKYPPIMNLTQLSAKQAYEAAGLGPEDIDVAQVYDAVAPGELWDLEELGLCGEGEAPRLLKAGVFDLNGKLPVNTDGGLIARGHPLGASAGGQIYELVLHLRGDAGPRQVKGAKVALAHAMGAGPNSAVTILKN
ncbi:thiolase family protein [Desulfotomaculum copahuensis]|uniref:thiolase family protein n=1 Tax=Desulfotomaculum copahuensis TaxID=1838280 RepID=UPI0013726BBD|nr:thiolase family protein [Desulfotomaculum copahuensis]